jgi:hypothetical protein
LAGINNFESLYGHALIGNSWEGYAIEQIHQMLPGEQKLYYYTKIGYLQDQQICYGMQSG